MKLSALSLLVAALATVSLSQAADITGVITLKGTPPAEKEITPLEEDPTCGSLHTDKPMTQFYVVSPKGELADVVVSLNVVGKSTGADAKPVVLDQKGCLYVPTILAVQTGQKVVIKNSDPCIHNVHTTSKAGNTPHNDAQMAGGADLTYTFDKPEDFMKFQCDVHPWMFAWVTIVDSPYFAVTDKSGKFTIKNVPPGKYTITAEHRKLGKQTLEIEVKDASVTASFPAFEVK
ncbi:MAG TPA: carboxypeptidase regulatory-like domain-containing protein [Verrucomicrobiae bacterium]|jgi:plastocyanin